MDLQRYYRLEAENETLKKEKQELEEKLKSEQKRLREACGAWRRLAQQQPPKAEFVEQGYRETTDSGYHFKVYLVKDIPLDLDIEEVMKALKEDYAPLFHPYRVFAARTDSRRGCWLVEVRKDIYFDMYYDPSNKLLEKVFGANDNAEAT
jgi:hypothetical protein